jgi:hypothetical protein
MCLQEHTSRSRTCKTHGGEHLAAPSRTPSLTRMPKIECLATTRRIIRVLPSVSARVSDQAVSPPAQTSTSHETTRRQQLATPTVNASSASAANDSPLCPHRRSHAIVQGRFIPFCSRCGDPNKSDDAIFTSSGQNTEANATIAVGARPLLNTMQGFPFDLRRSRVEAGRLME